MGRLFNAGLMCSMQVRDEGQGYISSVRLSEREG